jgi:surface antigen
MKKLLTSFMILICSASLAGCQNMSQADVGTMTGAVAGGLLGSMVGQGSGRILAIGAGALAGSMIGNAVGKKMDETDQLKMQQALENNQAGQPAYWRNQKTGVRYEMTPVRNVTHHGNKYCREYRTTADVGGKQQQVYGTACRQPDGAWKIVK